MSFHLLFQLWRVFAIVSRESWKTSDETQSDFSIEISVEIFPYGNVVLEISFFLEISSLKKKLENNARRRKQRRRGERERENGRKRDGGVAAPAKERVFGVHFETVGGIVTKQQTLESVARLRRKLGKTN